ncbi:MAG: 50S ribosomal protein L11 methyltransferase [Nitrospirota bacterium]|nr:50S ribosomal protein L11 methyltransferase [Nitrospirota bacterium]
MKDKDNIAPPNNHYAVATTSCNVEDSPLLQSWISSRIQSSLLLEEGSEIRITFALPELSPLEWALFKEAVSSLGGIDLDIRYYEEEDWQELWKEQGFKRFRVLDSFTVVPAWDTDPAESPFILIDPHLAFGTGWHETTHRCLEVLVRHMPNMPETFNLLDFGSGTGILGIAALKLHSGAFLTAIDDDPYAVDATVENLKLNNFHARSKVYGSWEIFEKEQLKETGQKPRSAHFSMILANVTGGVIRAIAPVLWDCLDPGGILILSGVSEEERGMVEEILQSLSCQFENIPGERYTSYCLIKAK